MRYAAFPAVLGLALGCAGAALAQAVLPGHAPRKPEVRIAAPGGGVYDGPVINGVAKGRFPSGDIYEGEWKGGKPDGVGKMTYMLGGAYEGEWKNGRRHGRGIMTFAGSGRRAEVRFVDGRRVDIDAEPAPAATDPAGFSLASTEDPTGSHIRTKMAYGPLPLDRGYDELTPDQQRLVRSWYPALDAGDTPPYPLKGGKELYNFLVSLIRNRNDIKEEVLVYVALDADAKVETVTTITELDARARDLLATAAGLLAYKPAQCGGRPCPGVVPFHVKLLYKD
jgi:hypothetical protein